MVRKSVFAAVLLMTVLVLAGCNLPALSIDRLGAPVRAQTTLPAPSESPAVVASQTPAVAASQMPAPASAPIAAAPAGSPAVLAAFQGTLESVYSHVSPSVVNIQVTENANALSPSSPFAPQAPGPQMGLGSGFVWDTAGHIVTNNHVVEGATDVSVTFMDGTTAAAKVVGTDPASDLAVVQVDVPTGELQPVQVADSTQVQVGQLAIAIGNPFGLQGTMTEGIVSAVGRSLPAESTGLQEPTFTIPDVIQTDAAINPGNSGGVLVNDQGQLIGVTAAIRSPVEANAGIGFAIPSAIVQQVVPALITSGHYEHPWLGISGTTLTPDLAEAMNLSRDQRGAIVVEVVPGGPAEQAGLRGSDRQANIGGYPARVGGDVIVAIDGQPVKSFEDMVSYLARNASVGQKVTLTVVRGNGQEQVELTLTARPASNSQSFQAQSGAAGSPWLGISARTITPEIAQAMSLPSDQQGVLIEQVQPGSPAEQGGLLGGTEAVTINGEQVILGGDILIALDGQPVSSVDDLAAFLQQARPGQETVAEIVRGGEGFTLNLVLGERGISAP